MCGVGWVVGMGRRQSRGVGVCKGGRRAGALLKWERNGVMMMKWECKWCMPPKLLLLCL